jgi:tetratricopeptide (TPR) repeat protein
LDPLSSDGNWWLVFNLLSLRRHDEALEVATKMIATDPNFWGGHLGAGVAKLGKGMAKEGLTDLETAAALQHGPPGLAVLALGYGTAGLIPEAQRVLERLRCLAQEQRVAAVYWAMSYAAARDEDQARRWLERAIVEHDGAMTHWRGFCSWTGEFEEAAAAVAKAGL